MTQVKRYSIIGAIFVLIVGTISHFLYEWTGNNFLVGLFTPINESIWEHMKLFFFPMLFYSFIMTTKLNTDYPCLTSALPMGILIGTALIPVIFYTYTGVLGKDIFLLDIATFVLSVIIAFYIVHKLSLSCKLQNHFILLNCLVIILIICFLLYTYYPPEIGLFVERPEY